MVNSIRDNGLLQLCTLVHVLNFSTVPVVEIRIGQSEFGPKTGPRIKIFYTRSILLLNLVRSSTKLNLVLN